MRTYYMTFVAHLASSEVILRRFHMPLASDPREFSDEDRCAFIVSIFTALGLDDAQLAEYGEDRDVLLLGVFDSERDCQQAYALLCDAHHAKVDAQPLRGANAPGGSA